MQVGGKTYTEKEAAGQELLDYCKQWKGSALSWIATYRGMGIGLDYDIVSQKYFVNLNGSMTYKVELGSDPRAISRALTIRWKACQTGSRRETGVG